MFPHCQQLDLKQGNFLVILKQTIIFPPRQTGAKTSQTGVKTSQTGAKTSQTGAKTSQTGAKTSQTGAKTSSVGFMVKYFVCLFFFS